MGQAPLVNMVDTVPGLSSKRTRGEDAHFRIPKEGTSVRVFLSGIRGAGDHMGVLNAHLAPSHCLYNGMVGWQG